MWHEVSAVNMKVSINYICKFIINIIDYKIMNIVYAILESNAVTGKKVYNCQISILQHT